MSAKSGYNLTQSEYELPSVETIKNKPLLSIIVATSVLIAFIGFLQPAFFIFGNNSFYTLWLWTVGMGLYWFKQFRKEEPGNWRRHVFPIIAILSVSSGAYVIVNYSALRFTRVGIYTDVDLIFASLILGTTLIATYRDFGPLLFSIGVFAILYGVFAPYLPGIFRTGGIGLRVLTANTIEFQGIFGYVAHTGSRWVFIFLIYAGMMQAFGGLDLFMQVGIRLSKYISSGVTQTAVLSSLIIGSISGSAVANVALTGSFTIPLMKRRDISPETAAAIESVASSGGQIMPPVMGVVAFIMADLLQLSYTDIIIMAAVPGIIFYLITSLSVHLIANREAESEDARINLRLDEFDEYNLLDSRQLLIELFPFILSLVFLIAYLIIYRSNPAWTAFWAIVVLAITKVILNVGRAVSESDGTILKSIINTGVSFFDGLYKGMDAMVPIIIILAHLGIIITIFNITSFGHRMALQLVHIAEISMPIFLLLLTILVIFLGMGMPTLGAYLLVITVAVPALVEFGFPAPVAHFFVLYVAITSNITPPIAMACAVAANVAGADFFKTSLKALKIGMPLFILPFIFLFNQTLIVFTFPRSIYVITSTFVGLVLLIIAIHKRGLRGRLTIPSQAVSAIIGSALILLPILHLI